MAEYKWVRDSVTIKQDNEELYGREIGQPMSDMIRGGWEPVTATSDPAYTDTVLVLMRKESDQ